MQDEQFMRQWNAGHVRFSGDLDRILARAAQGARRYLRRVSPIGGTYEDGNETPLVRQARLTGNAVIGGVTTGAGLALILIGLAAVLPSETGHAVSSACLSAPAIA